MSTSGSRPTFEQLRKDLGNAPPSTPDDVIVLMDGRRLDTKEKVLGWLAELEVDRAAGRSVLDSLA